MALLSARDLTRRPLFEGRSLTLEPGERVVLRGPTGCGKTLLLRALADLDTLDGGRVHLDGHPREHFSPAEWRRRVLYLHPTAPRFEGTVGSNLERVRARVTVPRELPALESSLDAAHLSSGQAQLLALHRALGIGPRILLLDEPTAHLDPDRARAVERCLAAWCTSERALLWISHDPALAGRLGAREELLP